MRRKWSICVLGQVTVIRVKEMKTYGDFTNGLGLIYSIMVLYIISVSML